MCQTRWVEKYNALEDFHQMFEVIISALEQIADNPHGWDAKALSEAKGLLNVITTSDFLAAFESTKFLLGFTRALSTMPQKTTLDIVKAKREIDMVLATLKEVRASCETHFSSLFQEMVKKASVCDREISKPRICRNQTLRENVESQSVEEYFR